MSDLVKKANFLFANRSYDDACAIYRRAIELYPELSSTLNFNIKLAIKKKEKLKNFVSECKNENGNKPSENLYGKNSYKTELEKINSGASEIGILSTHQIKKVLQNPETWESTGIDPYFILDATKIFLTKYRWYQLTVTINSDYKNIVAKIYVDDGAGFNEDNTINLPITSGKMARRIFYIKNPPQTLRFDPKEKPGKFRIEKLNIDAITSDVARDIMLSRLSSSTKVFEGLNHNRIWEKLVDYTRKVKEQPISVLRQFYNKTFTEPPRAIEYRDWIDNTEAKSLPTQAELVAKLNEIVNFPLISIVMPVYNTDEVYLRACIESVLAQSYPHWELCIADDKSPKPHVRMVLKDYEARDRRIKVIYRQKNGHISHASNSALQMATGEFVALLDHDDALPEHALYFVALTISQHPDAKILYSDEDKIDTKGQRFEPHFKSDWNPDLFFSQNYVSHLGVYKRELLNRIKGFRASFEGSQDQDLLLRCLPHVKHEQIIHIPRVLYHWRTTEGSTALGSGEKNYTTGAGIKALRDYFAKHGPHGVRVAAGLVPNTYRTIWPHPKPSPLVTLLIPMRDKKEITEVAVCSILEKTIYPNFEIIILDNCSVEPVTLKWFSSITKRDARVRVIPYDHPFNYSAINNFGVKHAMGSVIGLINNDVEVINPEWLTEMVSHACRPEIGCVGAKLYYNNDTLQHGGVIVSLGGVAGHSHKHFPRLHNGYFHRLLIVQNLSAVTGACLLVRREIYETLGGLDEENLKVAFNDVDFCLRVRNAGFRNLWTPYAELYHHESLSRGFEDTPEKQARFKKELEYMKKKWGDQLNRDPYYNPNLTKAREDFSIGE